MIIFNIQLKDFVQRKKYNPEIDDNYFAKSQKDSDIDDILKLPIAKFIIAFYAAGFILVLLIAVILLVIYLYTKRWDRKLKKISSLLKGNKYSKSKIFGVAITCSIMNIYILILDIFAEYTLDDEDLIIPDKNLSSLPHLVLGIGGLSTLICAFFWFLSLFTWCKLCCKDKEYIFVALSILGPIFSLVIHLPYITIAFLNDAYHASSVFIFYTIVAFILFGAVELCYGTCQGALFASKNGEINVDKLIVKNQVTLRYDGDNPDRNYNVNESKLTLNISCGTKMETEFLAVKEQQIAIKSIEIELPSQTQVPNFFNVLSDNPNNIVLTLHFNGNEEARVDNDNAPIVQDRTDIISIIKSQREDETSNVKLRITQDLQLNIKLCRVNATEGNEKAYIELAEVTYIEVYGGTLLRQPLHPCPRCSKSKIGISVLFAFTLPLFLLILLILIVMVTAVLVIIPINNAFSDAPNRLIGFYQSVVILVGAYLIYKNFFKRKPTIETAIEDREKHIHSTSPESDDTWQQLSKEERVAAFYSRLVGIVANEGNIPVIFREEDIEMATPKPTGTLGTESKPGDLKTKTTSDEEDDYDSNHDGTKATGDIQKEISADVHDRK